MIDSLSGIFRFREGSRVTLEVNGVGYGVDMPLSSICDLPQVGSDISLFTHTYVREDTFRLFGFRTAEERQAFAVLIGISGVGPKVALAIMSTMSVGQITDAVRADDTKAFELVPGIGKRSAEKIMVELRGKVDRMGASSAAGTALKGAVAELPVLEDVRSALENFGFKTKDIDKALTQAQDATSEYGFADLMRAALAVLRGDGQKKRVTPDTELF